MCGKSYSLAPNTNNLMTFFIFLFYTVGFIVSSASFKQTIYLLNPGFL